MASLAILANLANIVKNHQSVVTLSIHVLMTTIKNIFHEVHCKSLYNGSHS